jgi:hypothetical protein
VKKKAKKNVSKYTGKPFMAKEHGPSDFAECASGLAAASRRVAEEERKWNQPITGQPN